VSKEQLRVAIVCDWLTNMGGAEHVVLSLHKAFPDAPIYTSVFAPEKCPQFKDLDIRTTYLQHLPRFLRDKHQLFAVLRAYAFRRLNLRGYDIIISSASAEAKAVRAPKGALHICYCHTPTRYYWSHYHEYKKQPGFGRFNWLVRLLLPLFVGWMRRVDLAAVKGVDEFIANSHEVQGRIKKYYHRDSTIIFPPVETNRFIPMQPVKKADFYLVVGRQIPYKRVDLAIRACNVLERPVVIIGNGSEHEALVKIAGPTVEFVTDADDHEIARYLRRAKAFIFPAHEDFGIVPLEAMAAGTPVIAYGQGGALDTVKPGVTGLFFKEQTIQAVVDAITQFEKKQFDPEVVMQHAKNFDEAVFIEKIRSLVASQQD
jgi:glycosyltransferase involved in cell wall biosynthesis